MMLNKGNIILICLLALIPSVIISSYSLTELNVSRDSYSTDNYILFEDRDGVDQFWVDGDGFVYANGTLLTSGGSGGFSTVYKTADETITNDSTFTDDADLNFEVDANGAYLVIVWGQVDSHSTPDYKHVFSAPSGSTISGNHRANSFYSGNAVTYFGGDMLVGDAGQTNAGELRHFFIIGYLKIGGTGGTVAYQWAQNISDANNTTLKEGATIMYKKLN